MNQRTSDASKFSWDAVKYGVLKEDRHEALAGYFNWLRDQYYSRDEIIDILMCWNRLNKPPMYPEEVVSIIYDLWEKRPIRKLALYTDGKKLQEGDFLTITEIEKMLAEKPTIGIGSWFVEPDIKGCYRWKEIRCSGTQYRSTPSPCNQWICPACFHRMRKEWIDHIIQVTKGQDLYLLMVTGEDWFRLSQAINNLNAEFLRIREQYGARYTIIVNKPIETASKIPRDELSVVLEARMPKTPDYLDYRPPVWSSPKWMPTLKSKYSTMRLVIKTWLPLYRQKDIAVRSGASICGPQEWQPPEDVPQREWEDQLAKAVSNEERTIDDKLNKLSPLDKARTRHELYFLDSHPELFEGYYGKM